MSHTYDLRWFTNITCFSRTHPRLSVKSAPCQEFGSTGKLQPLLSGNPALPALGKVLAQASLCRHVTTGCEPTTSWTVCCACAGA